jgi:RNA polymerase-binding protein
MPRRTRARRTRDHERPAHQPVRGYDDDLAARQSVTFVCPHGHDFALIFADDVDPPPTWECRSMELKLTAEESRTTLNRLPGEAIGIYSGSVAQNRSWHNCSTTRSRHYELVNCYQ